MERYLIQKEGGKAEVESDIEGLHADLYTKKKASTKMRYGTKLLNTAKG